MTTACVVIFGVLEALVVAVGLSMIDTVRRSARPHDAVLGWVERLGRYADVSLHRSAKVTRAGSRRLPPRRPALLRQRALLQGTCARGDPRGADFRRWLVFDAEAVTHADSTGLEALADVTTDLRRDGITLVVARLQTRLQEQFEPAGVLDVIGRERFYPSVRAAVDAYAGSQS